MNTKVKIALNRIANVYNDFGSSMFIGNSGGKDSCVILHLAQQVNPDIMIVHNVKPMLGTSGDAVLALTEQHPETLKFLYTDVCKNNIVTMLHSSAMSEFIRINNLKCQIDGARISEHNRPGKSSNFIRDGKNVSRLEMKGIEPNGIFGLTLCYPILDWTDDDVFDYLTENNIPFSDEYKLNGEYDLWKSKK